MGDIFPGISPDPQPRIYKYGGNISQTIKSPQPRKYTYREKYTQIPPQTINHPNKNQKIDRKNKKRYNDENENHLKP
ncbi:hypothetical protein HMPREF1633_12325 [Tissierellia bacterium S5-A11]|nr:hypothetical protein HMPREF1633_12325 [Tissierellia bacterium S5-A11]